ncbi:MAG: ATP-grasp domain-containing protein [Candidatus Kerfeldbacteria bacterium]|nr:ATP-grasp domain-containing protein [Candidatus Kerfeldbacteria bacterium]
MAQSTVFSPVEKRPLEKKYLLPSDHVEPLSLSRYLPSDTAYFYGFPSGEDSNFFNAVPAWIEELVAGRILTCAGPSVRAVEFAASMFPEIWNFLKNELGVSVIPREHTLTFPEEINADLSGSKRNTAIRSALQKMLETRSLVMAQPYLEPETENLYHIPPQLTNYLNDKMNLASYIPTQYLPKIERTYANGLEFSQDVYAFALPCVVKVSSSSSGDGVRICQTQQDLQDAKRDFQCIHGRILIEEFIPAPLNICVQFGIPWDAHMSIEVIGYHQQLTSTKGEFLGGIVRPSLPAPSFDQISSLLLNTILPRVREMGWYGVGGLDVLIARDGRFYFIDPNFRMNATTAYLFHVKNGKIRTPVLSFIGLYKGTFDEFRKVIAPIATEGSAQQRISIVSLTKNGVFRFHAGLLFNGENEQDLSESAKHLLDLGISSRALEKVCDESV